MTGKQRFFLGIFAILAWQVPAAETTALFGIRVVDEQTGRGIPLIELRTVNDIRLVTDNAGWIAFDEPGLMGREVWFYLSHHPGYTKEKDGFGYTGARFKMQPGGRATLKLKRTNVAERIGRLTGQGLFRHCERLGEPCPLPNLNASGVMGQDSVQATPWNNRIFWLWGDTNLPGYPLGNFQTTAATTPAHPDPEKGLAFEYFMDPKKPETVRHMMPVKEPGAVWLFGLTALPGTGGKDALLAHWGRHKGLEPPESQGIAVFNEATGVFENRTTLDGKETWRFPRGNSVVVEEAGARWLAFASPFLHARVSPSVPDALAPEKYEALVFDPSSGEWVWQREKPPTTQEEETRLLKDGRMQPERAKYQITDAATGEPVLVHGASVRWNAWRKRFILIALQKGTRNAPSFLGEVWYAESTSAFGPWRKAVKIASHPRYSYYNPVHHSFLDAEDGKIIYFEGTYSLEFSGNPLAPARYDYNQLMYRLDLSDPRLEAAR
ncbi:MAG: hypothetical protein KA004_13330 [Verrucomicrobiales bacterium]|nr:hypothetical protein [Verrucomicrobiales bacterium]